jgi:nucleotide-binding universal stress UspA family protein
MASHSEPNIIVGASASLSGLAALRFAVAEARRRHIDRVIAVRAWPDASRSSPPWATDLVRLCLADIDAAIKMAFVAPPTDLILEPLAPRGRPGPELVRLAHDDGDLIVVGTGRRYRIGRGVGGYCCRHAPCPVIVVPQPSMAGRGNVRRLHRSLRRDLAHLPMAVPRSVA